MTGNALWLDIAGLTLAVTADADLPIAADGSARKFVTSDPARTPGARPPFVSLHARWGDPRVPADGSVAFDSGKGLWRLYRTADGPQLVFTSPALGPDAYQAAAFSEDFRNGLVTIRRAPFAARLPVYPLHYPLDELLMVHLLSRGLGVEVHAAGVVLPDGRGWLFVGVSGAGKSTLSRLWRAEPDVTVLSDERIVLRREAGGLQMYGTPWHGDGQIAEPGSARLDRVFFLRHGARNELAPVAVTDAITRLFVCGFTPFHDAAGLEFSLGFLEAVARECPGQQLRFVPDRSAVAFLRSA
ncbi:MAG TPA: hypothetical protein VHO67_14190 [Polyangia bacterium]|nr:hypothetical protein [Polyangia bacterium]